MVAGFIAFGKPANFAREMKNLEKFPPKKKKKKRKKERRVWFALQRCESLNPTSMEDHDLELEKVRLLSLALDFGFDEDSANKCLHRLIKLYGIIPIPDTYISVYAFIWLSFLLLLLLLLLLFVLIE